MHRLIRSVNLAFVAGMAFASSAKAQEIATAWTERGPRFLLATATKVVSVDVRKTPVLARRLNLELEGATFKQALAEIGAQAGMVLAFSDDVVPLDKRVHLRAEGITTAAALTDVLFDTALDVVFQADGNASLVKRPPPPAQKGSVSGRVTDAESSAPVAGATVVIERTSLSATAGNDGRYRIDGVMPGPHTVRARYIGYAPETAAVVVETDQEAVVNLALMKSVQPLDEVVTTGTMVPTEVKALPTPVSVITAEDIERQNLRRADQIFRGQVPGAIALEKGPTDFFSEVAVRGSSSLGNSGIKTYVDGVEVANTFYLATIDPNSIERMELVRGPQASTLYGSEALNGVLQIFTKKGEVGLRRPQVSGKLSAGAFSGIFGAETAVATDNAISVSGGSDNASYNVGGAFRRSGEWTPNYGSTEGHVAAGFRVAQGAFGLAGSARYATKTVDFPWMAQFRQFAPYSRPLNEVDHVRQQTFGVTATYQATPTWRHTATLGYDATPYSFFQTEPSFTTPADSFRYTGSFNWSKASVVYHTDLSLRLGPSITATATGGVNYFSAPTSFVFNFRATNITGAVDGLGIVSRSTASGAGYFGQAQVAVASRLFLTAGIRADQNDDFGPAVGTVWSPRVGVSYMLPVGHAEVKLRASHGEAIRAPVFGARDGAVFPTQVRLANADLRPERQQGVDAGIDIFFGRRASLGVTYYNQRAVDLVQLVTIPTPPGTVFTVQNQNVGEIKNEGWEFEGRLAVGSLELSGTYSITHSTIAQLPLGYTGSYQLGDQVTGIPRTVAGAAITYAPIRGTTLTMNLTHLGHYTSQDFVAYYGYLYGGEAYRGSERAYWTRYPTVTKLGAGLSQRLTETWSAFVQADNLTNTLRHEDSNSELPLPRSVMFGGRFSH
jgi:outer membrane receptor protein involved in Fe transport